MYLLTYQLLTKYNVLVKFESKCSLECIIHRSNWLEETLKFGAFEKYFKRIFYRSYKIKGALFPVKRSKWLNINMIGILIFHSFKVVAKIPLHKYILIIHINDSIENWARLEHTLVVVP